MASIRTIILALTLLLTVVAMPALPAVDTSSYLDFPTFRALTALVPEVPRPRVIGLTEDGHALWAQGQLRLPAVGHFAEGDFTGIGTLDAALLFEGGNRRYLLVAGRSGERWFRKTLLELQVQSGLIWDGKVLRLGPPETFLEWDGRRFRLVSGPLANYAYNYSTADFSGVLLKFTYIGPQREPYPGLLVSSYYRVPDIEAFRPHRRPAVHYGNDDAHLVWQVTTTLERLRGLVLAVKSGNGIDRAAARTGQEPRLSHSLSVLDVWSARRPNAFEALLTLDETASLLHTFAHSFDGEDPMAARILREYLAMFGK